MALIGMPGLPSGWGPAPMFLRLKGNNTTLELIAIKGEESMSYNSRGYLQSGRTGRTNYNSLSLSSGGISFQPMDRDPGPEVFRFKGFESQSTVSSSTNSVEDNKVYDSVEQEPRFPGGQTALLKYVADHLEYPAIARENGIQGRVIVGFVVKKDGSIGTVRIVRGKDPELDKEAVRVIKTLPRFTPGKMNGHPVNVWYTLPITFKLSDKSTTSEQ
ncbi:MAG: energy transducer TonB [Paramuribaculum sp.]|nr:energy transducer TonB [Paramuribaculum sp.]MDE6051883.1 energy transducer TonB [Paramuribaculum sp.]